MEEGGKVNHTRDCENIISYRSVVGTRTQSSDDEKCTCNYLTQHVSNLGSFAAKADTITTISWLR